jgi:2-dehydropantoate 2-reductase
MASLPFQETLHILGSGSIGLLWAASIRSTFPKYPVTCLLRSHHRWRIQQQEQIKISWRRPPPQSQQLIVTHVPAQIIGNSTTTTLPLHSIQNLLVTTKAHQAVSAVQNIRPYLDKNCNIIVLCNGALAVRDELQNVLKDDNDDATAATSTNLILATTTHGAYQEQQQQQQQPLSPFKEEEDDGDVTYRIQHAGLGKTFVEDRISGMGQLWDQSGLHCTNMSCDEMHLLLWQKLAANCVINPLTAIYNCPNGELLMEPSVPEIMHHVLDEISQVAKRMIGDNDDHDYSDQLSTQVLTMFVRQVMQDTRSNKSSMLQDVLNKRRTEVDYLNGYVVAKGMSLGLECPANQDLCDRIQEFKIG